jgi:hypothetical protein
VHPGPHGRLVFVVAELLAADELAVELVAAADADDVVLDDDEEPELHAESAAAAAASNPTDTAIPRRMITADSFRVWSFEGTTTLATVAIPQPRRNDPAANVTRP